MSEKSQNLGFWLWLFVWGTIGTAVAHWLAPLFWWVGMLVGGGGAYLAYDFKVVLAASWNAVKQVFRRDLIWQRICRAAATLGFLIQGTQKVLRQAIILTPGVLIVTVAVCLMGLIPAGFLSSIFTWVNPEEIGWFPYTTDDFVTCCILCFVFNGLLSLAISEEILDGIINWRKIIFAQVGMLVMTPICHYLLPEVVLGVVIAFACWFSVIIKRVLWLAFKAIHSDTRLVYGLSAGAGVVAGYLLGPSPIWAPLGGLVAVVIGALECKLVQPRLTASAQATS